MKLTRIAIMAALILSALALLAFGPRASDTLPGNRVIVEYWEKWTGNEGRQLQSMVDKFNRTECLEKGIFVHCLTTSDINDKTLIAVAEGAPPDVAGLWDFNLVQFAALDALEPLEDMAKPYGITQGYYKPVYWDTCTWDGHLYALVSTPATVLSSGPATP